MSSGPWGQVQSPASPVSVGKPHSSQGFDAGNTPPSAMDFRSDRADGNKDARPAAASRLRWAKEKEARAGALHHLNEDKGILPSSGDGQSENLNDPK